MAGITEVLTSGITKGKEFGRKLLSPVIGLGQLVTLPFRIPWEISKWGFKKGWQFGLEPALHGLEWTSGVALEGAAGLKDMIYKPVWALTKSVGYEVKGTLWDLPKQTVRTFVNSIAAPIASTRDSIANLGKSTLNWLKSVPQTKLGSTIQATRDAVRQVIIDPTKQTLSKWKENAYNFGEALAYPHLQLVTKGVSEFYSSTAQAATRTWNAPSHGGKWLWFQNIKGNWLKKREEAAAAAAAATTARAPASAPATTGTPRAPSPAPRAATPAHAPAAHAAPAHR